MKNHDLLDAIGEVSEETVRKYALPDTSNSERAKEEDIMDKTLKQPISQTKKKPFRINMGTAAAAVALCVGLNAAIIFGVHKMKQDAAGITSGSQTTPSSQIAPVSEPDQPYMEVMGANETEVTVKLKNPTNKAFTYHSEFAVMDGKKKITVNRASVYELDTPLAPQQTVYVVFAYQRQKPGKYKFVNLNKDSTVSDSFEPVEFEIPAEQKDSIRVPELIGMDRNEAAEMYGDRIHIVADSFEYSGYEENRIFDQDIPAEGLVSTGTTVHVKVSLGNKKVLMPDLTDWDFETAKSTIVGLGLMIDKRIAYDPEVEAGRVISTDPEGPVEIEPGSYVRVTVSLGKNSDTVPVPNFVNMDWDTAKTVAEGLHLELVKKQIFDEAEKGTVLKQSVQPTEEVGEGSVIELTVSTGAGYEGILVPQFVGMQWELAETTANALKIPNTKKVVDDDAPAGTVIAQDVDPGTVPDENTLVTLTVSSGQKQEAVRISFNIPAGAAGKYHIALYESGAAKAIGGQFDPEYAAGVTSLVIEGSETIDVVAVLVNDGNGKEATIGTYRVDFENRSYETISEDIAAAFEKVQ